MPQALHLLSVWVSVEHQEVAVWTVVALSRIDVSPFKLGPATLPPLFVFFLFQIVDVDAHVAPLALVKIEPIELDDLCTDRAIQRPVLYKWGESIGNRRKSQRGWHAMTGIRFDTLLRDHRQLWIC